MPSAFLFDLDGTLLDSDPLHCAVFIELLAEYGLEADEAFYRTHIHGRHNSQVFSELLPSEDPHRMDVEKERRFRESLAGVTVDPMPGLVRLLDRAATAGVPVAVATNAPRDNAEAMLNAIGLRHRFGTVVSADDVDNVKPAPDVYLSAAAGIGADPARALAFEDSPSGLRAARASGATVIGLSTTLSDEELRHHGAHHVIRNYEDPALEPLLGLSTGALS